MEWSGHSAILPYLFEMTRVPCQRIAILHTRLSGYMAACLREFRQRSGAELLVFAWPNQDSAPFDVRRFADLGEIRNRREYSDAEIEQAVRAFRPDAILVSGWGDPGYVRICRVLKHAGVPVIAGCDTQWKGSLRQHLAALVAPWHIQRFIDVLWVTGERQRILAKALGFEGDRCMDCYYACDWERFGKKFASVQCSVFRGEGEAGVSSDQWSVIRGGREAGVSSDQLSVIRRDGEEEVISDPLAVNSESEVKGENWETGSAIHDPQSMIAAQPHFLFVGRYVVEKGIDTLLEAYRSYREQVTDPWGLRCAGAGPLRELLKGSGVDDLGFVQPDELPSIMAAAAAFVLPSRFEPWGVVAHEAAASGLPLILSDACGAGVHLLRPLHNGYSVAAGSVVELVRAMVAMHGLLPSQRRNFGHASWELSKQYTPERWAAVLTECLRVNFSLGRRREEDS
jgi:glycosyltransferase involved in cell wall biosynthesis